MQNDSHCPTPHINAEKKDFADVVLMPGDPLRSRHIAEDFLSEALLVNDVRGVQGYTGKYKGMRVSCMASGMGMPSIGLYSYELFNFFDVKSIFRIGSAGSLSPRARIGDTLIVSSASYLSSYADQFELPGTFSASADFSLLKNTFDTACEMNIKCIAGPVLSSDIYYDDNPESLMKWKKMGILAVEMETAALYMNAARAGKKAVALLTISNSILTGEDTSQEKRNVMFDSNIELALETSYKEKMKEGNI